MSELGTRLFASTLPTAALLAASATIGAMSVKAEPAFDDFFDTGKLIADVRYRFEQVEQDGFTNDADAHTLRARVGFQTGKVWDLQGLIEGEGIVHFNDDFNDTVNGNTAFPIIADPEDFQINRLQIEYTGIPQTAVTIGRQRINLDNQRFVGGVAFRQNEQTFDAARITNTSIENLALTYIYVNRINRIFGEESTQGAFEGDTHLFNAGYDIKGWGKLSGYAYLIELEDAPQATIPSTKTLGLRFAGKHDFPGVAALYAVELATQSDHANNPASYDVGYWLVEAGIAAHGFKLSAGVETLEGDGVNRFQTPLATLHKFQGYADVFLVTPANGITDRYGTFGYETKLDGMDPLTGVMAAITYHDFETERGGGSLGTETDVELVARFGDQWSAGIKYADYDGIPSTPGVCTTCADRSKLWLSVDFTY
jgi:hypothetical protein